MMEQVIAEYENQLSSSKEDVAPNYWLVGSYWYNSVPRERLGEFKRRGVWINGHGTDKFHDRVQKVRQGDILICKSTYAKRKDNYLKIKAVGVVKGKRLSEPYILSVDWNVTNYNIHLEGLGFYRDTIEAVRPQDLDLILESIEKYDSEDVLPLRHALSTKSEDGDLIALGYENQGVIGHIYRQSGKEPRKALNQVYFEDVASYFYYFEPGKEDLRNAKGTNHIGYCGTSEGLPLRRYFRKQPYDHFYCTNPDEVRLKELGYREEPINGFENAYLLAVPTDETVPLYVYSTQPEVVLFKPLPEPEASRKEEKDYNAFLWSDAAAEIDELGRDGLVKDVVSSIHQLFESDKYKDAYTVLLNGEWGTGKSSMLRFFEKHLMDKGWHVVHYNAWENQQFKDPWWILINAISKYASDHLKGDFFSHSYWRFRLQYRHKLWAVVLLAVFITSAVFLGRSAGTNGGLTYYTSIIGLVTSGLTAVVGILNNFFFRRVSDEELKQQFTEHPFEPIRKRFNQIAENNNLAIFIDDLDRCGVEPTVKLLEGIQNLFKGRKVLYIIAADGRWVSECFNQRYKDFNELAGSGCSIGDKFLQKSFQLTLNVPKPNQKLLTAFWDKLIGSDSKQEPPAPTRKEPNVPELSDPDLDIESEAQQIEEGVTFERMEVEENLEKYLKKFLQEGVPDNPRQMKRFINQYVVMRQTMVVEGLADTYRADDRAVRYLIFSMKHPSLAYQMKTGELTIEEAKKHKSLNVNEWVEAERLLKDLTDEIIRGDFYSF